MIKLNRIDKMSIYMEFNNKGMEILSQVFCYLNKYKTVSEIVVDFDFSILSMKKKRLEECTIKMIYNETSETKIAWEDGVVWSIEPDDVEYGVEVFEACKKNGYFSPAEFIMVRSAKNKNLNNIYCKMI